MNIEHENTARALKEQPLFATRQWRCRFGIHTWLLWDKPIKRTTGVHVMVEQYRTCGCCGQVDRKLLSKEYA